MVLSKERKIYLVLSGIALLGLGIDRVLIGTELTDPNTASAAADASVSTADLTSPPDLDVLLSPMPLAEGTVAHRLKDSSQQPNLYTVSLRDMFIPSSSWGPRTQEVNSGDPRESAVRRFYSNHRLEAVMTSDAKNYALLDGTHMLQEGDQFDGFKLVSIADRSVTFQLDGHMVTLPLQRPNP